MFKSNLIFIFMLAVAGIKLSAYAQSTVTLHGKIVDSCTTPIAPTYSDLTPVRKLKLATAYFVNPELVEKSNVVDTYELSSYLKSETSDVLLDGLKDGTFKLAFTPNDGNLRQVVPLSLEAWKTASMCPVAVSNVSAFGTLTFDSPKLFSESLKALSQEQKQKLFVIGKHTGQVSAKYVSSGSLVTWDSSELRPLRAVFTSESVKKF